MSTSEEVIKALEAKTLTRIVGKPITDAVDQLGKECAIMCAGVTTTLAGGGYGHLALVEKPALYIARDGAVVLARPTNPGPYDTEIRAAMQPSKIERHNLIHNTLIGVYEKYDGMETAVKAKIQATVDPEWLEALHDDIFGFV